MPSLCLLVARVRGLFRPPVGSSSVSGPIDQPRLEVQPYDQAASGVRGPASACGPTAAAMIMNYWAVSLDRPGLHPWTGDHSTGVELINSLRPYLRTWWLGTTIRGLRTGLAAWAQKHCLTSTVTVYKKQTLWDGSDAVWNRLCHELDAGRPCAFYVGDPWRSIPSAEYRYHWMTATGYKYDPQLNVRLLRLNNSHGGTCEIDFNHYTHHRCSLAMVGLDIRD